MKVMSIDPGDKHNGVAFASLDPGAPAGKQLILRWSSDWGRFQLIEELEGFIRGQNKRVDVILIEQFRLYPWMAREQGYSDFPTVKIIGIVEYLASKLSDDVVLIHTQTDKKNLAVPVARANQPSLLRKFPNNKKHPEYFKGSSEHERDAIAHLAWFAWRNKLSPLHQAEPGGKQKAI